MAELSLVHEAKKLTETWTSVILSLCYCFFIGRLVEKGFKRLLLFFPVISFFLYLPLHLSTTHMSGITGFFISWLANFKLSLYAFGKGPLSSNPSLSLPIFLLLSCFPIKLRDGPKQTTREDRPLLYGLKTLLLLLLIKSFHRFHLLPETAVLILYGFYVYLLLDLSLAFTASLIRAGSRLELDPQFNEPYLATSLQDFWGKRWNLMVSDIMRPTVYEPVLRWSVFPRKWAPAPAAFATFVVSGLMHELILFYMGRMRPSGKMMCFFLLHGLCTMTEIAIKKAFNRRWKLPTLVAWSLTVLFVFATVVVLFFPDFQRCEIDQKAFAEYAAVGTFLQQVAQSLNVRFD